jgi:uncharacterized repeat protein (TIGR01451 family)
LIICLFSSPVYSQQFDIALTKTTVTNSPVKYGTMIPFNLTIYNQGTDTLMNVEVIDHFGGGYEFQNTLNPEWNEHPTIVNAVNTVFMEKIPPGENRIITLNLITGPGSQREDWINTAEVVDFTDRFGVSQEAADMDSTGDEDPDNDAGGLPGSAADNEINGSGTGSANDGVAATDEDDHDRDTIQIFDLALTKVLDPITGYKYGDTLVFTTTVYNQGNIGTRLTRVRDIIPEGYINPIAENVAAGWSNNEDNPIFTFDEIPPFTQVEVDLKLILNTTQVDGDAWINYAEVISSFSDNNGSVGTLLSSNADADSQMASNSDGERSVGQGDPDDNNIGNTSVNPGDEDDHDPAEPEIFDLALIKERATALSSFNYGTPIDYSFTVVNQGNIAATDIIVLDSLPCGAMFDQDLNPNWTYDPATRIATYMIDGPLEPLAAGSTDHLFMDTLTLIVVGCFEDQSSAWTNYMEISQATNIDGIQTEEIDGVFDSNFKNDPGGIPMTSTDNSLTGVGIIDEDNHDVELLQVYDLALKKELLTAGPFTEGQDVDFRIRVYNQGNVVIQDLVVEDFVPEGFGFDLDDNAAFGWTTSYAATVGGSSQVFPDTLNVMEDLFLETEDSVDIMIRLQLEYDGTEISDWYNFAHIWVATDTVGNSRFDDADSNPFTTDSLEFAVIPGSINDNNIFSFGKSVTPQVEEDDHDVANVSFFDLALTKTATSTPTGYGQDVTFDIVVRNEGVQFAHDITVVDYLPCGLTFSSSPGWVVNGTTGNPEYFFTDTLFAGEAITIPITLTVEECTSIDADSYRNEAEILDALNDGDVTGDDQDSTPDNQDPDEDDIDDALISVFDLSLSKTVSSPPANFSVGSAVTYDIVITNEGNVPATNVEITDLIPCGLDFAAAGNMGWSQDATSGNVSYVEMSTIAPGSSATVSLTLTIGECVGEPLDLINLVEISDDDLGGPVDDYDSTPDNGDPNEDDIDSAPLQAFDLSLEKTLTTDPSSLTYGQNLDYQIIVSNTGSIEATSFTVTDYLACGLGFVPNNGWTLDGVSGNIIQSVNTPLLPGESITLDLTLTLEECTMPTVDSWNNIVEITEANDPDGPADDIDSTPNNNDPTEDDQDNAPLAVGDLALSKSHADPISPIGIGTVVEYSIVVTNQGNVPMVDFVVTDYIPCGLSFSTDGNTGWVANGDNAEFTVTTPLAPGASTAIPLTLTIQDCAAPATPDYVNRAEISDQGPNPDDPDSTPDNNPDNDPPTEDDADSDPLDWFDLSLTKTSNLTGSVSYGDVIAYALTVSNEGSLAATNVEVSDYLACGLRFDAGTNPGWNIDQNTGYVNNLFTGTIAPGESRIFTLNLILEPCTNINGDSYRNVAEISGGDDPSGNPGDDEDSTPDNNPDNDSPTEDDTDDSLLEVFDLSLTKAVVSSQSVYQLGQEIVYNITVTNEGNVAATDVEITDYIPCGMTLSPANTVSWSVGANGFASTVVSNIGINDSETLEIILTIEQCATETGTRNNRAEISDSDDDADSTPDNNPNNDPDDEDDNDEVEIEIEVITEAIIGDFVFNDIDGDGIQDSNEPGISGVIVTLFDINNQVVAESETGLDGIYEFEEIDEGNYYVTFTLENDDLVSSPPNAGNNANDSNITGENGPGSTAFFEVIAGQDDLTIDAGFFACSLIKGVTYYDVNEDDIRQSTENGINGLLVNLFKRVNGIWILEDSQTTQHDSDTASDDGIWEFCVGSGEYYIEVVAPPIGLVAVRPFIGGPNFDSDINGANGPNTTPTFTIVPGGSKTDLGAGYYPMATVGNRVWLDENFNGLQESNEAKVEGVTVQVYNTDHELVDEAITNSEGVYKIEYLQKEEYYLKFEAPEGYSFTSADAGSDDVDSDVNHMMGLNTTGLRMFNPGDEVDFVDAGLVSGVLPVIWKDVGVNKKENHHIVYWNTAQENNVEYYRVERKLEHENKFEPVGTLDAYGNSSIERNYELKDFDIQSSGRYYYRIQQIDYDGKSTFSEIVYVNNVTENEIEIYPNPAVDNITVKGEYVYGKEYKFILVSMSGQTVFVFNIIVDESEISLDVNNINAGIYYLEVYDESGFDVSKSKFFKK